MIYIASDHAAIEAKEALISLLKQDYQLTDFGPHEYDAKDDYPDYAKKIAFKVSQTPNNKGILMCGTGIGMCIAANKISGVYAAVCHDETTAQKSREHNNTNVICLPARQLEIPTLHEIVSIWLNTSFSKEERHQRRFNKIKALESLTK